MNKIKILFYSCSALGVLTKPVHAENGSLIHEFLGSPLLILAAVIGIDIAAYLVNKLRR